VLDEQTPDDLIDLVPLGEQYMIPSIKFLCEVGIVPIILLIRIRGHCYVKLKRRAARIYLVLHICMICHR
jgi:hypothetical protein